MTKNLKLRNIDWFKAGTPLLVGLAVFLFWLFLYPQYLSYQEQYQLFLWTDEYFVQSLQVCGGFIQYLGEFVVQFYAIEWLGAILLAVVFAALQTLTYAMLPKKNKWIALALSLLSVALLIYMMGDENVMLAFPLSIICAMGTALLVRKVNIYVDVLLVPCFYWLIGPMVWLYVILRLVLCRKLIYTVSFIYVAAVQLLAYNTVLQQWPLRTVMLEMGYYRYAEGFAVCDFGFDKDKYELIKQDYLIRNERWDEIIVNAEKYTVPVNFWSESVNLALGMKHQLANRQFYFYQSGVDALLMRMVRDLTSNLPTMEAFYRLGLINESMRYAFDIQESIPYGRKSGRLCKRIVECCIINGKYEIAKKYIGLLKKTLYYREWSVNAERYLWNESWINGHPEWGYLRKCRLQNDIFFSYTEKDKILGQLFVTNPENKMALEYFLAELLLNGNIQSFTQYLGWAQQYGGYSSMPIGYQDAMQCIEARGDVPGSKYSAYAKRMKEMIASVQAEYESTSH